MCMSQSLRKKLCVCVRLETYRFIDQYHEEFGIRWLLRRIGLCPNAYYNYRRHRKADYYAQKYDRSVIASVTDRRITSGLAIRTLQKALDSQPVLKGELILHSDQGSQYTSKAFVEFCESVHVTRSMSKAGYPYDNAPMERYFNTLKNECTNLYEFCAEDDLYQTVEEFAYVTYNYVRPHSYNGCCTPYQARRQYKKRQEA